jgi:hypothetical protein
MLMQTQLATAGVSSQDVSAAAGRNSYGVVEGDDEIGQDGEVGEHSRNREDNVW